MTIASATPFCVGITAPTATSYPTTTIAGHEMVEIPGGFTVTGSGAFKNAKPRWVWLSPYLIDKTAVNESKYCEGMDCLSEEGVPADYANLPATGVGYDKAVEYLKKRGGGLMLPTEVQWENAARGPAVNIPELMRKELGRYKISSIVDFVEGRFENLVFGVLGEIITDPKSEVFQWLVENGHPFFGWRVYGTPSGRLTHDEAWFDQEGAAAVDWGPPNAYGLYNMTGNVWELVQGCYQHHSNMLSGVDPRAFKDDDFYGPLFSVYRGGCWRGKRGNEALTFLRTDDELESDIARFMRVAYREGNRATSREDVGFRAAAPLDALPDRQAGKK